MKPLLLSLALVLLCSRLTAQIRLQREDGKAMLVLHNAPAYRIIDTVAKYFNCRVVYKFNKERISESWAGTMPLESVENIMTSLAFAHKGLCYLIDNKRQLIVELN